MKKEIQDKLLKIVKQNYEEIAEEFDETRQKRLWPEVAKLAEQVRDGDSVFDVGCGNGRLLEAFKDKKISYFGVDASEKLINLAEDNFQSSSYKFLVGDILELDKTTQEKFDYIFCIAVLHHIPGEDLRLKAFEQMKNRLKPDGRIILTVWNLWSDKFKLRGKILKFVLLKLIGKNRMDWGDVIFDWKKGSPSSRYYHAFTAGELKKIIGRPGFRVEKFYKDKFNYYFVIKNRPA